MVSLFAAGTDAKGRALADSLGQRLDDIPQYGLQFDQVDGLESILESYRTLNPEINSIAITVNGRAVVHTDASRVGASLPSRTDQSEYRTMLTPPNHPRAAQVVLSIPRNYVVWQVVRNIKNYAALFVASSLFAFLFLQLAQSIQGGWRAGSVDDANWRSALALELVKPVFFLATFVDHLSYAFLPQFIGALAIANGDPSTGVAWPFTAYYLSFALALLPAGYNSARIGPRNLVVVGLAFVAAGLLCMTMVQSLGGAVVARAMSGAGQGVLFIGVQSYILARSLNAQRTRANGIIVYGYQGGMISGMAIGSLLAGEIGAVGVFSIAGLLAALVAAYSIAILPSDTVREENLNKSTGIGVAWRDSVRLLRDPQFAQTIFVIGIPAKAVLTGVVLFGMPLLLHAMGFAKEDIGQVTMVYGGSVILASFFAGRFAERGHSCRNLLVVGMTLSAVGLLLVAATGYHATGNDFHAAILRAALFVIGAAVIGLGHGLINAPVVTYVTETSLAARLGAEPVAAGYRFIERVGHMLGPIIVGQLFVVFGLSPLAFGWLALAIGLLAFIFHVFNSADVRSDRKVELA
jgi:predicted MFS family arabinose efflux permease